MATDQHRTGPILLIKYIVDQRRSDSAQQVCCGPAQVRFWLTKYGMDQRRSDLAHQICCGPVQVRFWPTNYAVDQRRSDFAHQIYCGPAYVRFSSPSCCGPAKVRFCLSNILWTNASPILLIIQYVLDQCKSGFGALIMQWTSSRHILLIEHIVD